MSIFKKIGKFLKKVAHVALPILKFGIGFVPGVGTLAAKAMSLGSVKKTVALIKVAKGAASAGRSASIAPIAPGVPLIAMMKHGKHPHKVAAMRAARRPSSGKRKPAKATRAPKRAKPRKLKFGSPAWRKKYVKKR